MVTVALIKGVEHGRLEQFELVLVTAQRDDRRQVVVGTHPDSMP